MRPLACLLLSFGLSLSLVAQHYSFPEVKESLFVERPQTGSDIFRKMCLGNIDDLLLSSLPDLTEETRLCYTSMINKAIHEIRAEQVTSGVTVWQIFNHGFVVKTPTLTIGFDLKDYYKTEEFLELANLIDIYFISHEHKDHSSPELIELLKTMDKPIVGCAEWFVPTIGLAIGESKNLLGLTVTAHYGKHSVPVRQFEVLTHEGIRLLHTGDNQTSETLPEVDNIDILLLNSWVNEGGAVHSTEGVRLAVNKIAPKVTLPGHIMELWHLVNYWYPVSYRDAMASDNGTLLSAYYVLAWGERFHYGDNADDTTPPEPISNMTQQTNGAQINMTWTTSLPASDGDTASFYRINLNNSLDFYTNNNFLSYTKTYPGLDQVTVYAYDDCGNQSTPFTTLITAVDEEKTYVGKPVLYQNYPNPAFGPTTIHFKIPSSGKTRLEILNSNGQIVKTITDSFLDAGSHTIEWHGDNNLQERLPSGIYIIKMEIAESVLLRKALIY